MASNWPRVPTENATQYTLDSQLSAGGGTITLNQSVTGLVQSPGRCVIDRVDSAGNKTPTKREYKYFTGVSGATLTGVTNDDGTDQVHAVGAIVEFVPTVGDEEDKYTVFTTEHTAAGVHALDSLTAKTTNGDLTLAGNGTGKVKASSIYGAITTATPDASATATLNLATSNKHNITMPAGNITIALSNAAVGQVFTIRILQDDTGSRTVTWPAAYTISWAGGSAPTLTTTANKADMFIFVVTGASTLDAFIVGQNI